MQLIYKRKVHAVDVRIVGEGPAIIVALHGIQGTRAAWQPVARELAGKARFVQR